MRTLSHPTTQQLWKKREKFRDGDNKNFTHNSEEMKSKIALERNKKEAASVLGKQKRRRASQRTDNS